MQMLPWLRHTSGIHVVLWSKVLSRCPPSFRVNSAVKGNHFDKEVIYLVSVIRVICLLLNSLLSLLLSYHYYFLIITTFLSLLLSYHYYFLIITIFLSLLLSYHYYFLIITTFLSLLLSYHFYFLILTTACNALVIFAHRKCCGLPLQPLIWKRLKRQIK